MTLLNNVDLTELVGRAEHPGTAVHDVFVDHGVSASSEAGLFFTRLTETADAGANGNQAIHIKNLVEAYQPYLNLQIAVLNAFENSSKGLSQAEVDQLFLTNFPDFCSGSNDGTKLINVLNVAVDEFFGLFPDYEAMLRTSFEQACEFRIAMARTQTSEPARGI